MPRTKKRRPMSSAERQRDLKDRWTKAGYRKVDVWINEDNMSLLEELYANPESEFKDKHHAINSILDKTLSGKGVANSQSELSGIKNNDKKDYVALEIRYYKRFPCGKDNSLNFISRSHQKELEEEGYDVSSPLEKKEKESYEKSRGITPHKLKHDKKCKKYGKGYIDSEKYFVCKNSALSK